MTGFTLFLSRASQYGIIVELTLLSNTYSPEVWALNPFNANNNINALEDIGWMDYNTMRNPKLFDRQVSHVRKIVEETNRYDNIIYEICNEPGGGLRAVIPIHACRSQRLANRDRTRYQRNREATPTKPASDFPAWRPFPIIPRSCDRFIRFESLDVDIVNIHPPPLISHTVNKALIWACLWQSS